MRILWVLRVLSRKTYVLCALVGDQPMGGHGYSYSTDYPGLLASRIMHVLCSLYSRAKIDTDEKQEQNLEELGIELIHLGKTVRILDT